MEAEEDVELIVRANFLSLLNRSIDVPRGKVSIEVLDDADSFVLSYGAELTGAQFVCAFMKSSGREDEEVKKILVGVECCSTCGALVKRVETVFRRDEK